MGCLGQVNAGISVNRLVSDVSLGCVRWFKRWVKIDSRIVLFTSGGAGQALRLPSRGKLAHAVTILE